MDIFYESESNGKLTTTHIYYESEGKPYGYTFEFVNTLQEAEYQGRKVKLGKPMQGDVKKFKVYVKNPKGNVVKVNFGHGGSSAKGKTMNIRKSNPKARNPLGHATIVIVQAQDIKRDTGPVGSGK